MGKRGLAGECRLGRTAIIALIMMPVLFSGFAKADTIIADSCSYEDVSSAIDSAESGDTVIVPAGECVWDETLTISKGIMLQGAGIDKTVITSTVEGRYNYAIDFNYNGAVGSGYVTGICGFTLKAAADFYGLIKLSNQDWQHPVRNIKVYDNKLDCNGLTIGIVHYPACFGVIYNNIILDTSHAWRFLGGSYGWCVETWVPGTSNAMYYEDNYCALTSKDFDFDLIVSGGAGNRYVGRYNTFNLSVLEPFNGSKQWFDIHGNQGNNNSAGIGLELYGNLRVGTRGALINHRGGQVFFFLNQWKTTDNNYLGTVGIWEEFNDDDFQPVKCDSSTYAKTTEGNVKQRVHNSYYWRNYGGVNGDILSSDTSVGFDHYNRVNGTLNDPLIMFENKQWFRDHNSAFDGEVDPVGSCGYYGGPACEKSGVGCGSFADMLAIEPKEAGLGFWVTGQSCSDISNVVGKDHSETISGTLYRSVSDGKGGYRWEHYYTPYKYPHPLRSAPVGVGICAEGQITNECWCEGVRESGYCWHGYYVGESGNCDVNRDTKVNIQDVQCCVNQITGSQEWSGADVNGDGAADIQDVQAIVNELIS